MQTANYFSTSMIASNDAYASSSESIILQVNSAGYTDFSLSVTNYGSSTLTTVNIYASADGINYYTVHTGAITTLTSGSTGNYSFTSINRFLQISATSAGTSHITCALVGGIT